MLLKLAPFIQFKSNEKLWFVYRGGRPVTFEVIFQVWEKVDKNFGRIQNAK